MVAFPGWDVWTRDRSLMGLGQSSFQSWKDRWSVEWLMPIKDESLACGKHYVKLTFPDAAKVSQSHTRANIYSSLGRHLEVTLGWKTLLTGKDLWAFRWVSYPPKGIWEREIRAALNNGFVELVWGLMPGWFWGITLVLSSAKVLIRMPLTYTFQAECSHINSNLSNHSHSANINFLHGSEVLRT